MRGPAALSYRTKTYVLMSMYNMPAHGPKKGQFGIQSRLAIHKFSFRGVTIYIKMLHGGAADNLAPLSEITADSICIDLVKQQTSKGQAPKPSLEGRLATAASAAATAVSTAPFVGLSMATATAPAATAALASVQASAPQKGFSILQSLQEAAKVRILWLQSACMSYTDNEGLSLIEDKSRRDLPLSGCIKILRQSICRTIRKA